MFYKHNLFVSSLFQGRRCFKKVTVAGTVTLHHRYIYRGYLQIACVDLTRSGHPALWFVLWDPSQLTATRSTKSRRLPRGQILESVITTFQKNAP